nr:hypothetical protein [Tanacetum cinerariifolium]
MNQNFYEPNMCSNSISSDFDQLKPPPFPVIHQPPQEMSIQKIKDLKQQYLDEMKRLIISEYRDEIKIDELEGNFNSMSIEINAKEKLQQLEQVSNLITYPSKRFNSFCYDDDDDEDYTVVITPYFSITDSLIMKNEHLDTIPETESDEFIKSGVENLVQIPSESKDFFDIESECDMSDCDDSQTTNFSTFSNPLFDDSTSSDDESSHEEDSFIFDLSINPFPPADMSAFYEFADELTHIISPPKYDCVYFKIEPNSGDFTMDVVEDTFPTREPRVHNALPTHFTFQLNMVFILSSESLFAYVVWNILFFLSYLVAPQYLLSLGNEDTIFDPGICSYHIFSFLPDVSYWSGTFIKFKVLNESPM